MIKAEQNKLAHLVFSLYLKSLLKSSFKEFIIINELPMIDNSKGLIVTPNHFSWWDGFFVYWLNKKLLKKKLFILMLEEQLMRYWFFKYLGCYSIELNDKRKTFASLKYTLDLVSNSDNVITIYPQGEIHPYDHRPIVIKDGINFLSQKARATFSILPIAFKIHYSNEKLPTIYVRFGKLLTSSEASSNPELLKNEFINNLNMLNSEYLTTRSYNIIEI